jgi:hypothetical protein
MRGVWEGSERMGPSTMCPKSRNRRVRQGAAALSNRIQLGWSRVVGSLPVPSAPGAGSVRVWQVTSR